MSLLKSIINVLYNFHYIRQFSLKQASLSKIHYLRNKKWHYVSYFFSCFYKLISLFIHHCPYKNIKVTNPNPFFYLFFFSCQQIYDFLFLLSDVELGKFKLNDKVRDYIHNLTIFLYCFLILDDNCS